MSAGRTLTYGELRRRSRALAAHLSRTLPDDGSPVAVFGHKEPEMLVGFLGAVRAGHPYVPLDTALPGARVEQIVRAAGARVTLTAESVAALSGGPPDAAARWLGPDDPYYVIFTSGSTGEPKGVVVTLACLESFVSWMLGEHDLVEGGEIILNQAPFSFDLSVMDLYLSLATGGTLVSVTAEEIANPRRLYRVFEASPLTLWVSTPSFARMCLAEGTFGGRMLPKLRRFLCCGETLAPEVAGALLDRFPMAEVWNTYGPTEATVATTSVRVDRDVLARHRHLPVGYPKPGTRILIVDPDGREVAPGERGEIVIAGPNVSAGYLGRPDLTERVFFRLDGERAYRTGDLGRIQDGLLHFEGRADDQLKLHGYRVELGDVEANLRALPRVRDAVVLPVLKDGMPDTLVAFVMLDGRPGPATFEAVQALRSQLAERVPAYMVPRRVELLETFPLTANGKVDRQRLRESLE